MDTLEERLRSALDDAVRDLPLHYRHHPRAEVAAPREWVSGPVAWPKTTANIPTTVPQSGPKRRRRLAVVASVAAACAAVVFLVGVPTTTPKASAATVLRQAEDNVGPGVVPGPGQYLYESTTTSNTLSDTTDGQHWTVEQPAVAQVWIGSDGSGREVLTPGAPIFPTAADRSAWVAAGSPPLAGSERFDHSFAKLPEPTITGIAPAVFPASELRAASRVARRALDNAVRISVDNEDGLPTVFPFSVVRSLPSAPGALETFLVDRYEGGTADAETTFSMAASLLEEGTTPAQRVGIFEMMADLPGITLDGSTTTDDTGRRGVELALTHGQSPTVSYQVIVDPSSGQVLEQRTVITGTNTTPPPAGVTAPQPTGSQFTVYQTARVVRSMKATT